MGYKGEKQVGTEFQPAFLGGGERDAIFRCFLFWLTLRKSFME